jgi:hypothetical protein
VVVELAVRDARELALVLVAVVQKARVWVCERGRTAVVLSVDEVGTIAQLRVYFFLKVNLMTTIIN